MRLNTNIHSRSTAHIWFDVAHYFTRNDLFRKMWFLNEERISSPHKHICYINRQKIRYLQIIVHYVKSFEVGVNKLPILFLLFSPFYYCYLADSPSVSFLHIFEFQSWDEKWAVGVWYEFTILCQLSYCLKSMLYTLWIRTE